MAGIDAELYYVRDNVVSHFALSFVMPVPSDTNSLHFTWFSKTKADYRLGFQVENPAAMNQPKSNISNLGEVPSVSSGTSTVPSMLCRTRGVPETSWSSSVLLELGSAR
ncbi:unnamed protein product [Arctogadus glacialis]